LGGAWCWSIGALHYIWMLCIWGSVDALIRRSFYGEEVKFRVMHLFWWSITFFCSVALIFWRICFPIVRVKDKCPNICRTF
jgi:hypothetical protein